MIGDYKTEVIRDAVSVMKQGGLSIADEAVSKWSNGKYNTSEESKQDRIRHWKAVRELVKELCSELKSAAP